jgi:hypothetical protein
MQHPKASSYASCSDQGLVKSGGVQRRNVQMTHGGRFVYVQQKCGNESLTTPVNAARHTSPPTTNVPSFGTDTVNHFVCIMRDACEDAEGPSTRLTHSKQDIN